MSSVDFGTLFEFIRNGMNVKQDKSGEGLPISRIETISHGVVDPNRVGYAGLSEADGLDWLLQEGDLLFSHINSAELVGKCAIYTGQPSNLVHGMNLLCLRPRRDRLDSVYAKYLIRSQGFRGKLSSFINKAVNQASVSIGNLRTIQVRVPPVSEQRRIAAILDQAEALRIKRRAALAKLDTLAQSIFIEMFGDHATILTKWPTRNLGEILDFLTSGSRGWAAHYAESGDLFLRIQNVRRDELVLEDVAFVNAPTTAEARRTKVEPGDVLLSITADLGRTAAVPPGIGAAFINQHLSILRTKALVPRFLSAYLASPMGQQQVMGRNKGGVKAGLNFDDIRSITVPMPPSSLQQKYEDRVGAAEQVKTEHLRSLRLLDKLFGSLQHRAFRGEL
jgi:type I restriction enzyme S subunit